MDFNAVKNTVDQADKALAGWKPLDNLHHQTGIPRAAVAGGAALLFLMTFFNVGASFLVNFVGVIVPSFYQLKDLHNNAITTEISTQWLSYWMIFTSSIILERLFNFAYWFPLYFLIKLGFLAYIGLPNTNGATLIYRSAIQPAASRVFACTEAAAEKTD